MTITPEHLREIIEAGESDKVEFKQSSAGIDGIARAVCAQANNLSGGDNSGYVIIGIADNRSVVGIVGDDQEQQRLAQVRLDGKMVPTPNMSIEMVSLDDVLIAVLIVTPSSSPPVRLGGIAYVRVGPTTGKATPDEERQLIERRRALLLPYDARGISGSSLSDLDLPRFQLEYLPQAVAPEVLSENGRSIEQQLASLKLCDPSGEVTPTGLLAIGTNPTNILPSAYIQFRRVAGTEITDDTLDQGEYRGTIADMLRALEEKINAHNLTPLTIGSGRHEIRAQYPKAAMEQLCRNAIMHRDYEIISPIRITWFDDRIQIDNPGGPFGIAPANFGQPGYTSYRNPNIAELMKSIGLVERFGVGIAIARRELAAAGHPPLELNTAGNFTFLCFEGAGMKTIAFFNNKGGVGKTSLVYHVAWMLRELGHRVVVADLDPQANLTTFFLSDDRFEDLFDASSPNSTIFQAFKPILEGTGDLAKVNLYEAAPGLYLIPGDLALSEAEDELSDRWSDCLSDNETTRSRAFRTECGFYRAIVHAAEERNVDIALIDVGPSLGSLNRSALIASDYVVIPLGSDAFSLQGVRNVGKRLRSWRSEWTKRRNEAPLNLGFTVPQGGMKPIGYLLSRFSMRLGRQTQAYHKWASKMPTAYKEFVLAEQGVAPTVPTDDENCLAELKDYRSLMPMAQEAGKPMFKLQVADGAIGAHQSGVKAAHDDFKALTELILTKIDM